MGLDMYLTKAKRLNNATVKEIVEIDYYLAYGEKDTDRDQSDIDMSSVEAYRNELTTKYSRWDKDKEYGFKSIFDEVAYWRKANHIHNWIVDNVQDGDDNCDYYEVTKEHFESLLDVCKKVLAGSNLIDGEVYNGTVYKDGTKQILMVGGKVIEDSSVARELLPTVEGFFFGGTDYDEYYIKDITYTAEIIEDILNTADFESEVYIYHSSW